MGTLLYHPRWMATIQRKPPIVMPLKRACTVQALVNKRRPLKRHTYRLPDGRREFQRPTLCKVNGRDVGRAEWATLKIRKLDVVQFIDLPPKLEGGGGFLQIGALVLALAVAVAVPVLGPELGAFIGFAAGSTLAAGVGGGLIALGGGLLGYGLMSLFGSPAPAQQQQTALGDSSQPASPTYSLNGGQQNFGRLGSPIPEAFGRNKMFPDSSGASYTRYSLNDQYFHTLLVLGIGQYDLEQVFIGDTPVSSFGDDITYVKLEPGEIPDGSIVDARWLTSTDMGQPELDGSEAGSPTIGPFAANPAQTLTSDVELDFVNPRGLFHGVVSGSSQIYESVHVDITIEAQLIDDAGTPLADWFTVDSLVLSGDTVQPLRWTQAYNLGAAGRYQMRCTRTDEQQLGSDYGHVCNWTGIRALQAIAPRSYAGVTTLAVRMKATSGVTAANSTKVAVIAIRKLPQWNTETQSWSAPVQTRSPVDAFAYIATSRNGGRLADSSVDLDGLYSHLGEFADNAWTFDFVFDSTVDCNEALRRVAASVVAQHVVQGTKLCFIRDVEFAAPVMMFGPRNILPGSLKIDYAMVDSTSADGVTVQFIDAQTFLPRELTVAYPDSAQERLTTYQAYGVTDWGQATTVGTMLVRGNRLRRRTVTWQTELEGLALQFGDGVLLAYDFPNWGQTAEIVAWDDVGRIATLSEQLQFTEGLDHYIQVRDEFGQANGPFPVDPVDGQPMQILVGAGSLPEILTGRDRERTIIQFGPGTRYAVPLKVKSVTPSGESATIVAFDDDPGMYAEFAALPDPGRSPDPAPIAIAVSSNTSDLDLRALANAAGYSGSLVQPVTVTINAGVTVSASSPAAAAVMRGSWPAGVQPKLVIRGHIDGADASGGAIGGTAVDARSGPLEVDNVGGRIKGGATAGYAVQGGVNVTWTGVDTGERIGPIV